MTGLVHTLHLEINFMNLHPQIIFTSNLHPCKNSIRDAHTPQPGEIVFNIMRYRSSETVQRSGYFQTNVPTKYQLPTPYGFQDIAQTRFYRSRSLQQGQRSNQGHTMTLHTYNPQAMSLSSNNFLHLLVSKI